MTHTALMNWEFYLDTAGIFCCVLSALYLIKLKWKSEFKGRMPDPIQRKDAGFFKDTPAEPIMDMSFKGMLDSATNDFNLSVIEGRPARDAAADPYEEARRLLNLGLEAHQVAARTKIPRCEIDMIDGLRQIQPDPASGGTSEKISGSALA